MTWAYTLENEAELLLVIGLTIMILIIIAVISIVS